MSDISQRTLVFHDRAYTMISCACMRSFNGWDAKRVQQHYAKHARRCTRAKRWARFVKSHRGLVRVYGEPA